MTTEEINKLLEVLDKLGEVGERMSEKTGVELPELESYETALDDR